MIESVYVCVLSVGRRRRVKEKGKGRKGEGGERKRGGRDRKREGND
jgi:hypothetical protein